MSGHHAFDRGAVLVAANARRCAPTASRPAGIDGASAQRSRGTCVMAETALALTQLRRTWARQVLGVTYFGINPIRVL